MHRTHLPLTLWFWAIYLCAADKRRISAVQLSHTLGICYDSGWHLLDRIRTSMSQRDEKHLLSGIVELDDGYVDRVSHNGKYGRGTDKDKIVVAISKAENAVPHILYLISHVSYLHSPLSTLTKLRRHSHESRKLYRYLLPLSGA